MFCEAVIRVGRQWAPCGRCVECRKRFVGNVRCRMIVEGEAHDAVGFLTCTFSDLFLPPDAVGVAAACLLFKKRVRRAIWRAARKAGGEPVLLRFWYACERGSETGRLHVHFLVFGADATTFVGEVSFAELAHASWGMGRTELGSDWSGKAAAYLTKYATKGRGDGEFWRYPQRPGLGVPGLAALFSEAELGEAIALTGDVPGSVKLEAGERRLPRYLVEKLRQRAGMTPEAAARARASRAASWSRRAHDAWLEAMVLDEPFMGSVSELLVGLSAARGRC